MNSASKSAAKLLFAIIGAGVLGLLFWMAVARHTPQPTTAVTPVTRHEMALRDGRWFRGLETNAFTGTMVDYYPGGGLMARSMISNGIPNGCSESWYTNGQMQVREFFRNGVSDGLREKWYDNGRKKSEAAIVEGKVTGTFLSWHEKGQLAERIEMKFGEPDGTAWAYYPSGFAKSEIALRDGKVLDRKSWKDGEHKTTQ